MTSRTADVLRGPGRRLLALSAGAQVLAGLVEVAALVALAGTLADLPPGRTHHAGTTLLVLCALWATLTAVAVVAGRSCGYGLSAALQESVAQQLLRLPLAWFGPRREGEISLLLGPQTMQVMSIPAHLLGPVLRAVVVPLALVAVIARHSPGAALVALAWLPVLAVIQWWSARRAARGDAALAHARAEASDRVLEYLDAQRTVRLSPDPAHAASLVRGSVRELARRMDAQVDPVVRVLGVFTLAVQLLFLTVLAAGTALPGSSDTPRTIAFVLATCALAAVLQGAAGLSATVRAAVGAARQLDGFLTLPALPEPATPVTSARTGRLEARALTLGPGPELPVVRDIDLVLEPGTLTVVVGSSGAGKTTLLRGLARFADPLSGRVLLDGVDVRELGSQELWRQLAMVFQDVELVAGTLADNIRLGRPGASDEEVAAAAHRAGMDEMLHRLPGGLATPVTDHGTGLSGGERQRVCVARALVKQAPVVLLDEPAASLDATTRRQVEQTVAALRGQATVVLVTHQLDQAPAADQVVVLDQGRLVECGTHDDLLSHDGAYARLWRAGAT